MRREARLLAAVAPHLALPVPRMTLHEGPPLFSAHAKLPGETLLPDGYRRLGVAARDRLADDLALFFAQLHAFDPAEMLAAGALPVGVWDTRDGTLEPVWDLLPPACRIQARAALDAYRALRADPLGERYGFFDAHGWNMAFDAERGVLNGIFDFADSGIGPVHREFAPVSLIDPDLTARTIRAYERLTGRAVERRRVFLHTAAMRLSELAGEIETGGAVDWTRDLVLDWFSQRAVG
ncbi:MAG: aminoglycoside phosphotransferase family protein, partial [Aquamicrobium sp.]|uniref:phosphotransferase family protein n=1 Tax=Aquamicrobium sp. TaxID=1872579 RepID=UPI00349E78CE|nr:aminoglycoside phosphotransferase family protein [Aquamicrobium sp.]